MKRSPNQRKSDVIRVPGGATLRLRPAEEVHFRLLDVDFTAPRERALSETLAAHIVQPRERFHAMPLAHRHWLVASLLMKHGTAVLDVPEVCAGCGELLELQLDLAMALEKAAAVLQRKEYVDAELRLPTPEDLDAAEDAQALLRRCHVEAVDPETAEQLLRDADPLGDVALHAACCQCGNPVTAAVDLGARWLRMRRRIAADLFEDIHTLASRYHWSESDVLALPESRRRCYLELCRADLSAIEWEQHAYI